MRFEQYLQEEYVCRAGIYGKGYEIFKNPTTKEVLSIKDSFVRCIADFEKKDLYVFSHNMIHDSALMKLQSEAGLHSWGEWQDISGKANQIYSFFTASVRKNGKLEFYRTDTGIHWYNARQLDNFEWLTMDDSWLDTWLGPNFIKTFRQGCERPKAFV